jgi:hypothetical protein
MLVLFLLGAGMVAGPTTFGYGFVIAAIFCLFVEAL